MRLFIFMLLGAALCVAPAHAAASDSAGGPPKDVVTKVPEIDKPEARKEAKGRPDDLVSCKQDAVRMHGPERSRFMTKCLSKRD